MIINRVQDDEDPYVVRFERDQRTGFYEQLVAGNAMMLNPYDVERLGIDDVELDYWETLAFTMVRKDNGDFSYGSFGFSLERLKTFGGLLTYYADTTDEELNRVANNNPPNKDGFASRRVQGRMALEMLSVITRRQIKVPRLWTPGNDRRPVGFTRAT